MQKVSRNNIGRFAVSRELMKDADMGALLEIFKDFFILKIVEYPVDEIVDHVLYVAVSPLFKEVQQGDVIPMYELIVNQEQMKTKVKYSVKVKEIEENKNDNWVYM